MVLLTDRLLTPRPVADLAEHRALTTDVPAAIAAADPAALIELITESGLSGRGAPASPPDASGGPWGADAVVVVVKATFAPEIEPG